MQSEQVLKSQFNIDITCSQITPAEQALKSQFMDHLQPNHAR